MDHIDKAQRRENAFLLVSKIVGNQVNMAVSTGTVLLLEPIMHEHGRVISELKTKRGSLEYFIEVASGGRYKHLVEMHDLLGDIVLLGESDLISNNGASGSLWFELGGFKPEF